MSNEDYVYSCLDYMCKEKLCSILCKYAAECRTGCMSAHECENARNHVAVSGLANTLHPVLFLLNWKTITFMSDCFVNLPLSLFLLRKFFYHFQVFMQSERQKFALWGR